MTSNVDAPSINTILPSRNTLQQIPTQLWNISSNAISDLTKLIDSPVTLDMTFRGIIESIHLYDLLARTECVARPVVDFLQKVRGVMSPARVVVSLKYFVRGAFAEDLRNKDGLSIASEAAYFVARIVYAAEFFVKHTLLKLDFLAGIAAKIGQTRGLSILTKITLDSFLSAVWIVALVPPAIKAIQNMRAGDEVTYNAFELASCVADIAISTLTLTLIAPNAALIAALSVCAAGTGIIAFYCNPDATPFKDPLKK